MLLSSSFNPLQRHDLRASNLTYIPLATTIPPFKWNPPQSIYITPSIAEFMMQRGQANNTATSYYLEQKDIPNAPLGRTGLAVSQVGFGAYRVEATEEAHYDALAKAIQAGVNVIDTSANYTDGRSEELVGVVLDDLIDAKKISREQVVVVTKGGYIQGENLSVSLQRQSSGLPWPDLVQYSEHLEHCIHPEFLDDQITRSMSIMGIDTLDVYLLHNPEYFLDWAQKEGWSLTEARQEFYRRIEDAFRFLEAEVGKGRIQWYGVSSNTLVTDETDPAFVNAARLLDIAESVSADHHFAVLEFPFNALESQAYTRANTNGQSLIDFCSKHNIGTLSNRPLNALRANAMVRLANIEEKEIVSEGEIAASIKAVVDAEQGIIAQHIAPMGLDESVQRQIEEMISVGRDLEQVWKKFASWDQWRWSMDNFFMKRTHNATAFLLKQIGDEIEVQLQEFVHTVSTALQAVDSAYRMKGAADIALINKAVADADKEWAEEGTMSQRAIRTIRTTEGVHTVLVGMREVKYVEDVMQELTRFISPRDRINSWKTLDENLEKILVSEPKEEGE